MRHHDLVILGTGSGNSLITPELEGLDIAIVEEGTFGGTCLNVGCIPTKMYVLPADRVLEARDAARLGVTFSEPTVDWPAIRDRIFGRIDPIAAGGEAYRRGQDFVTVYAARARFVGDRHLLLSTGEEITADRIVVAVGSRPEGYPVDGLRSAATELGLHTSDTVMRLEQLPERMIVLGGGFVACEFAHVFSALGVEVTQIQRSSVLLRQEEPAVAARYTELARERYDLRTDTIVRSAHHDGDQWHLALGIGGEERGDRRTGERGAPEEGTDPATTVSAPIVLLAVGRTPNSDRVDATAGGLVVDEGGLVRVDDEQRTTAPGVWALGDVSSRWALKHVANHEARIVAHNLAVDLGRLGPDAAPARVDNRAVPHAVFGHPQVASFGPTSGELEASGTAYLTKTQAFGDVAYGWALEDREGFLIVHADPDGHVLAAHCIGPHASTVIQPLIQAAAFGQRALDVARGQYWIHPALAEVVENALLGLEPAGQP